MRLLCFVENFGEEKTPHLSYTPVAMDVTPLDHSGSLKEKVGRTYKGCDGYVPMMAYVGTDGYLLNCELRPGVQHSQNGMVTFIGQTALTFVNDIPVKITVARRRLRRVIQDLIDLACKRVEHANRKMLKFWRSYPWFEVFQQLHVRFC